LDNSGSAAVSTPEKSGVALVTALALKQRPLSGDNAHTCPSR
jgi:hypothetical protein